MKLKIENVEFSYASDPVLKDICFEVPESQLVGLVGPNGAGKSTLIRCIDRILEPKGAILVDGHEIKQMNRMEIARKVGYVPQSASQSFPTTVLDVVLMGRRPHMSWRSNEKDVDKALEMLRILNIEELAMRDVDELSGGEQQKVFIARALAQEPDVLLLDEPTSDLDIRHQLEVMNVIKSVVREKEISAVIAIHDLNLAARYSDRIIMMDSGKIHAAGDPLSILTPENIRLIYGVEAIVNNSEVPHIIPVAPIKGVGERARKKLIVDERKERSCQAIRREYE